MKRAVIAAFLLTWVTVLAAQSVPNPIVTGPIPATVAPGDPSHNYPFFSTNIELAGRGYVEEEYFLQGTANTYNVTPLVPKLNTAGITGSGNAYRTRMIVRRPLSAEAFNGTVLIEWQNVTAGFEPDTLWIASHDHLMRRGYAWVGVTAQRAGVQWLKLWNAARYGTLSIPNAANSMNGNDKDGLSWDIFSQAAQAVRCPQGTDPMGALQVERIFAVGWSQSANRLSLYHNSIHPLANVFDAFGLMGNDGPALLELRTNLGAKVFKVLPETDIVGKEGDVSQALLRSAEPNTDHFRRWEVAGAAHMGAHEFQEATPLLARDVSAQAAAPGTCDLPPMSRIPWHFVINAAYDHMIRWLKHSVDPPIGPEIEIASWVGDNAVLARDTYGNALGGIRLSQHAVATATNTGQNSSTPATIFCRNVGSSVPFDQATLDGLYPEHGTYISQVARVTNQNKQIGFIVPEDAQATIRDAAQSSIGQR